MMINRRMMLGTSHQIPMDHDVAFAHPMYHRPMNDMLERYGTVMKSGLFDGDDPVGSRMKLFPCWICMAGLRKAENGRDTPKNM